VVQVFGRFGEAVETMKQQRSILEVRILEAFGVNSGLHNGPDYLTVG
jgi:hypothetical protein